MNRPTDHAVPPPQAVEAIYKSPSGEERFVDRRFENVRSDVIFVTHDKLENVLTKFYQRYGLRSAWFNPLSMLLAFVLTLVTAEFRAQSLGIAGTVWQAIFIIGTIMSAGWLCWTIFKLIRHKNEVTVEFLISKIKNDSGGTIARPDVGGPFEPEQIVSDPAQTPTAPFDRQDPTVAQQAQIITELRAEMENRGRLDAEEKFLLFERLTGDHLRDAAECLISLVGRDDLYRAAQQNDASAAKNWSLSVKSMIRGSEGSGHLNPARIRILTDAGFLDHLYLTEHGLEKLQEFVLTNPKPAHPGDQH